MRKMATGGLGARKGKYKDPAKTATEGAVLMKMKTAEKAQEE